jgi:hypothetical protein
MPEVSTWELIQEERDRFEVAAAARLGLRQASIKALRDGEGYGDRYYLNLSWYYWLVAVGLLEPGPDLPGNEHAVVDSHGQPLESLASIASSSVR